MKIKHPNLFPILVALLLSACQSPQTQEVPFVDNGKYSAPYAVGSATFFIHDESRPYDSVGGVNVGIRSLITEIWYPVSHSDIEDGKFKRATYGDYVFGDRNVHQLMMTQTTFFHLTPNTVVDGVSQEDIDIAIAELFERERNSYSDAPLAKSDKPWPTIVMTHGDAGSRYNMESACEYLAAQGFIVIAPEHTGNSPFSLTGRDPALSTKLPEVIPSLNQDGTYGSKEKYGQSYTPLVRDRSNPQALVDLDNSLLQRVNDLRATLAKLDQMNSKGRFAGQIDVNNIGLMGRSFGGTTTLAALSLEPRFKAGVAVVPLVLPDLRKHLPKQFLKATGQESVILATQGASALNTLSKPTMLLSGAEDALIIGAGAGMAKEMGGEQPNSENPLPALRTAYKESTQAVFWGLLENSNHSSFGVSGSYWWPQYKSKTQMRFFEPEKQFELIQPAIAHKIQKEKIYQFFDVMVRGNTSNRDQLKNNEFDQLGLQYESRNF